MLWCLRKIKKVNLTLYKMKWIAQFSILLSVWYPSTGHVRVLDIMTQLASIFGIQLCSMYCPTSSFTCISQTLLESRTRGCMNMSTFYWFKIIFVTLISFNPFLLYFGASVLPHMLQHLWQLNTKIEHITPPNTNTKQSLKTVHMNTSIDYAN